MIKSNRLSLDNASKVEKTVVVSYLNSWFEIPSFLGSTPPIFFVLIASCYFAFIG